MKIDIRTLAVVLCLTNFLQIIALSVLYRVKMYHQGLGWWILGSAALTVGFALNSIRDFATVGMYAIVANNALFVSGMTFIHTGIMRFWGRRERTALWVVFCTLVTLTAWYFTFIDNNLTARRVNISFAVAAISFVIARSILVQRTQTAALTSYFLHAVFLSNGVFFLLRGVSPFIAGHTGEIFTDTIRFVLKMVKIGCFATLKTYLYPTYQSCLQMPHPGLPP